MNYSRQYKGLTQSVIDIKIPVSIIFGLLKAFYIVSEIIKGPDTSCLLFILAIIVATVFFVIAGIIIRHYNKTLKK